MITGPCSSTSPDAVPALSRGQHSSPAEGMCLMEYVSLLAGCPFGDDPDCTHPLLAVLARSVNDATSPAARNQLLDFAAALAQASGTNPVDGLLAAQRCLALARTVARAWRQPRLRHLQRQLHRRAARVCDGAPTHIGDQLAAVEAMVEAVSVARRLPAHRRDAALAELLACGLGQARRSPTKARFPHRQRRQPGSRPDGPAARFAQTCSRA